MMTSPGHGYRFVLVDGIAVSKPCNLISIIFSPMADGDAVIVYDGLDISSGDIVLILCPPEIDSLQALVPTGIYCANGVYVGFSNPAGGRCTIVYDTVETL